MGKIRTKQMAGLVAAAVMLAGAFGARLMDQLAMASEEVFGTAPAASASASAGEADLPLTIHFLEVGQGDCIYINYGDFDMIIDGGENKKADYVVNYLENQGVKDIDLLVATHPHADHIGGLDDVIRRFDVAEIIDSGAKPSSSTSAFKNYKKAVSEEAARYTPDENLIRTAGALKVEVLEMGDGFEELNDESVVVKVSLGEFSALFTGDAEKQIEEALVGQKGRGWLNVDLFKAGHHGSKTSNTLELLEAMSPETVVVTAGENNDYGHPHESSLEHFEAVGATVYNTALSGAVVYEAWGSGETKIKTKR